MSKKQTQEIGTFCDNCGSRMFTSTVCGICGDDVCMECYAEITMPVGKARKLAVPVRKAIICKKHLPEIKNWYMDSERYM